jgi:hypothetical protein
MKTNGRCRWELTHTNRNRLGTRVPVVDRLHGSWAQKAVTSPYQCMRHLISDKKIKRSPPALCNVIRWKISSWRDMGIMGSYLAVSTWRSVEGAKNAWWQLRSCRSWKVRCSATACRQRAGNRGPAAPVHSQPRRRVESQKFHHHDEQDLGRFD